MSVLSQFLLSPYPGLSLASDTLSFVRTNPVLRIENADYTGSGDTYPRLILRNVGLANLAGPQIELQALISGVTPVNAGLVRGSMAENATSPILGRLELTAYTESGQRGVVVYKSALIATHSGNIDLGSATAAFKKLYLTDATGTYAASLEAAASTRLTVPSTGFHVGVTGSTLSDCFIVKSTGAFIFSNYPDDVALLSVGGNSGTGTGSQAIGNTGYGVRVDFSAPSTQTSLSVALDLTNNLFGGSTWTCATVAGIRINSGYAGAGASVTNHYGIYVAEQTLSSSNSVGIYVKPATHFGIVAEGPSHAFGGAVVVKNATPFAAATAILDVLSGATSGVVGKFRATSTSYAETAGLVRIEGADSDAAYWALRITDTASSDVKLGVRGDGAVLVNTASVLNTAKLSLAGRFASSGSDTYDLLGNTLAVDAIISSTHAVASSAYAQSLRIESSMALNGSGGQGAGVASIMTASAHVAGSTLHGGYFGVVTAGAGLAYGATVSVVANSGHTGGIRAVNVQVNTQAGTTASSVGVQVAHNSVLNYGFYVGGSVDGALLDFGVYVNNASSVTTAAFNYYQRTGSVGDFLRFVESGGTTRFSVSYLGDIRAAGTGRRILADFDNSTDSSRLTFQTIGSATSTMVNAAPSAGGTQAGFASYDGSDMDNAARLRAFINTTAAQIDSGKTGSGTQRSLRLLINAQNVVELHTNNDVQIGPGSMTTSSTAGFPYLPTCAGTPSGAATSRSGFAPIIVDDSANRIWIRVGSTWRYAALT